MAWWCPATSHYLNQCRPKPIALHNVIRPQHISHIPHNNYHANRTNTNVSGNLRQVDFYPRPVLAYGYCCLRLCVWTSVCPSMCRQVCLCDNLSSVQAKITRDNLDQRCKKPVNSLRPSDAIWRHRSGSTLAQIMAWCLTAPSHYLNQCWLIISKV